AALLFKDIHPAEPDPSIEFILSADETEYRTGDTPLLSLQVINHSQEEIILMNEREGSDSGFSFPLAGVISAPSIDGPEASCIFPGAIEVESFVRIGPGETVPFGNYSLSVFAHGMQNAT